MSCTQSENVLCKHPSAEKTFYVDLSFMPTGVTATSVTASTEDPDLEVVAAEVIDEDITVDASEGCAGVDLVTGRAVLVLLSGGVASDYEVVVTVEWQQSDGDTDARDLRLIVG
jgi:hypothetical protein